MSVEKTAPFSVSLLQTWPVRADGGAPEKTPEAPATEPPSRAHDPAAQALQKAQQSLIAGHLRIELDREAGRFVQTLTDPNTSEILRRFPYESQLAFARAVGAYMNTRLKTA